MKQILLLQLFLSVFSFSFSQKTPEAFIAAMPALPADPCNSTKETQTKYFEKLDEITDNLNNEILTRKTEAEKKYKDSEADITGKMMKNSGLSESDMQKLKNKEDMSEAEQEAIADKMMKEKYNISMDEAKNLKDMDEAGQKAWANAYAAEMMANAQANPQQTMADMNKNKRLFDLVSEQKSLIDKLNAQSIKYQNQIEDFNREDSIEKKMLERLEEPIQKELNTINDGEGSTKADAAHALGLVLKIYGYQKIYCQKLSPKYFDILRRYLVSVKAELPDYYRLQEVTEELTKAQTGLKKQMVAPDLMALESLSKYVTLLKDVFRFAPMDKPDGK